MGEDRILECTFFIPVVRDGDRKAHQPLAWNSLQDELFRRFHGSTGPELLYRSLTTVRGEYEGEGGERIEDQSHRYVAAVPESRIGEFFDGTRLTPPEIEAWFALIMV